MADEIFHGLVTVDVNDNDAIQKIASIVQGAKTQFAELAGLDVGNIGPDLTGPLQNNFGEIEQQIKKLQALSREAFANLGGNVPGLEQMQRQLREIDAGLDATMRKAREINAAAAQASGAQTPVVSRRPQDDERHLRERREREDEDRRRQAREQREREAAATPAVVDRSDPRDEERRRQAPLTHEYPPPHAFYDNAPKGGYDNSIAKYTEYAEQARKEGEHGEAADHERAARAMQLAKEAHDRANADRQAEWEKLPPEERQTQWREYKAREADRSMTAAERQEAFEQKPRPGEDEDGTKKRIARERREREAQAAMTADERQAVAEEQRIARDSERLVREAELEARKADRPRRQEEADRTQAEIQGRFDNQIEEIQNRPTGQSAPEDTAAHEQRMAHIDEEEQKQTAAHQKRMAEIRAELQALDARAPAPQDNTREQRFREARQRHLEALQAQEPPPEGETSAQRRHREDSLRGRSYQLAEEEVPREPVQQREPQTREQRRAEVRQQREDIEARTRLEAEAAALQEQADQRASARQEQRRAEQARQAIQQPPPPPPPVEQVPDPKPTVRPGYWENDSNIIRRVDPKDAGGKGAAEWQKFARNEDGSEGEWEQTYRTRKEAIASVRRVAEESARAEIAGIEEVAAKKEQARAQAAAPPPPPPPPPAPPATPPPDPDDEERRRRDEERRRRNAERPRDQSGNIVTSDEEKIRLLEQKIDAMRTAGVDDKGIAEYRKLIGAPEEEGAGGFRPRSAADLQELTRGAVPDLEALTFDHVKVSQQRAAEAFELATEGLQGEYKTSDQARQAEVRYLAALGVLIKASEALAKAEAKAAAEVTKLENADDLKAKALDDPRRQMLGLPNKEFLQQQGYDLDDKPNRTKVQAELDNVQQATRALDLKREEVVDSEEYNALMAKKKALAVKELQLESQLGKLDEAERGAARGDGGFRGGLLGKNKGDDGFGDGLGYQAGITLKYFALYSAFSAARDALTQIKDDTEAYTLAINQLAIATGSSYDAARKLSEEYVSMGAQVGQGPIATTQMMAKYARTYGNDPDTLAIGARVGGLVGTLEPKDHVDNTQQDLIAVAKAYGIGPGGSEGLLDQMLSVSRHYGYETAGDILPGVAAVGDIGKESGYNPAQLASLIAGVMQQTGVGSDAAAGDIKRFLGSQNDPGLVKIFDRFGINQDDTLREKLEELSKKISGLDPEEQSRVLTSAGNPRIAAAVVASIRGIPESDKATDEAQNATGLAADAARKKLATLSGELQLLGVNLERLFLALSDSGLADVLGVGLKALVDTVDLLARVVGVFGHFNSVVKDVIAAVVLLTAAYEAQQFIAGKGGITSAVGSALGGLRGKVGVGVEAAETVAGGAAGQAAGKVAGKVATTEGEAAIGEAMGAAFNSKALNAAEGMAKIAKGVVGLTVTLGPLALALAAIMLTADVLNDKEKGEAAKKEVAAGRKGLQEALDTGDPEKIQTAIDRLQGGDKSQDEVDQSAKSRSSWLLAIPVIGSYLSAAVQPGGLVGPPDKTDDQKADEDAKKKAQIELLEIQQREARITSSSPSSQYFGRNYNNISRGVDLIANRGLDAPATTKIVGDLLQQNPDVVRSALQPGEGEKGLADIVTYDMGRIANTADPVEQTKQYGDLSKTLSSKRREMAADLKKQQKALKDAQERQKLDPSVDLTQYQMAVGSAETQLAALDGPLDQVNKAFTSALAEITKRKIDVLKKSYTGTGSQRAIEGVLRGAMEQAAAAGDVTQLTALMDGADKEFNQQFTNLLAIRESILKGISDSIANTLRIAENTLDATPERATARDEYTAERNARNARSRAAGAAATDDVAVKAANAAKAAQAQANPTGADTKQPAQDLQIAQTLEGATTGDPVAQAKASLAVANIKLAAIKDHGAEYYNQLKEVNDLKRSLAEAELSQADAEAAAAVRVGDPVAAAKEAVAQTGRAIDAAVKDTAAYWAAVKANNEAKRAQSEAEWAQADAESAANVRSGDPLAAAQAAILQSQRDIAHAVSGTTGYWNAVKAGHDAQWNYARLVQQIAQAEASAAEIPGDPASAARIAINAARATMANTRDPAEYWGAVKALHQSQYDLARIELQNATARDTLNIDITDPVKVAQARVREAQRQLQFDRNRGAGQDVILQDQVSLRQSRSDAQGQAWSQEFADQRTNYDLQRTSLTSYLSYLRSQHDYLTAVKTKTRQQVDELNQVDQALKSLTEGLQGQWNLGDIKVPTAYEMRRQLMGGAGTSNVSYVTITMTGSSTAEMKAAIQGAIGQPTLQSVGTTPAKV